jgi:Co/Zn/Cd efflux system component
VAASLAILGVTAAIQLAIFALSGSVALLADLIHNFGDALTAVPLGIAFFLRSFRVEKLAGLAVVLAIFVAACVALYETVLRFVHPQELTHLWVLAAAGAIGFLGNEIAAQVRLHGGRRLSSPALIADGNHARIDGFVSLGVVASALTVALGAPIADPIIGLAITLVILKITWDSWRVVTTAEPGELVEPHRHWPATAVSNKSCRQRGSRRFATAATYAAARRCSSSCSTRSPAFASTRISRSRPRRWTGGLVALAAPAP